MEQAIKDKILQLWKVYDKKDKKDAYQYFNKNYSLEVLNNLSIEDQAIRLFATSDYAEKNRICRGYFCWAENGRKDANKSILDFGKAKLGRQPGLDIYLKWGIICVGLFPARIHQEVAIGKIRRGKIF